LLFAVFSHYYIPTIKIWFMEVSFEVDKVC